VFSTPEEGVKGECSGVTAEKAVILGSNEGSPGRGVGITKYSGCVLVEGNGAPECEISEGGTVTTNTLISEQVENVENGGGGKELLTEFFPATGSTFVTLHFKGSGCTTKETAVSGQAVAEDVTDNAAEEKIELGQAAKQATAGRLRFPATAIKEVWLIAEGVGKIVKTKGVAFGDVSTQSGIELILLANSSFVPEYAVWSAMP
jgi:hypothetical protein